MHLPPPAVPSRWTDVPPASLPVERVPVLILGAGVAGLRAALEACRMQRVLVLTKGPPSDSNTAHAQGGIAVAWSDDDTPLSHGADTIEVGQGLCDPRAVSILAGEATGRFRELLDWGARFDKDGLHLALGREGGHSAARILHARGDATGAEVMRTLLERASHEPSIELRAGLYAVDLLVDGGRCVGAVVHDGVGLRTILAGAVVLATGGAGHLFRETTNPPGATGDGVACAYRAGAVVRDLEFMQFHPTTLYVAGASRSLISEATRGEGAVLRNALGEAFMSRYHPEADLAPRDIVSRAILAESRRVPGGVFLDLGAIRSGHAAGRFPGIASVCRSFDLDIARDPIPVVPSAHYLVGGVRTDVLGRTSLEGLWACGECASCGIHGANRLASNSLLEGLVYGARVGADLPRGTPPSHAPAAEAEAPPSTSPPPTFDRADLWNSLRSLLWRQVGIERSSGPIEEALRRIRFWGGYVWRYRFTHPDAWSLQNALLLSHAMAHAALLRTETRGVHFREDFPARDDAAWRVHLIQERGREIRKEPAGSP